MPPENNDDINIPILKIVYNKICETFWVLFAVIKVIVKESGKIYDKNVPNLQ